MTDACADLFRRCRLALGYSQRELAAALRLNGEEGHRVVRRMECGYRDITGPIWTAVQLMLRRDSVGQCWLLANEISRLVDAEPLF